MKQLYKICKKGFFISMMMFSMAFVMLQTEVPAYAYTQEEIDAAKEWLSANGYSPDMGGAQAAYADYMNGKFGAIPGLPQPNVPSQEQESESEPQPQAENPEDNPKKDKALEEETEELQEEYSESLVLPDSVQQEFADMIDVFVSDFSQDDQEEISKAKARLEKQKEERELAEKEAEHVSQTSQRSQKNVITIMVAVLSLAVIGLGILLFKKRKRN